MKLEIENVLIDSLIQCIFVNIFFCLLIIASQNLYEVFYAL